MKEPILKQWTILEVKYCLNEMVKQYGEAETRRMLGDKFDKINDDFKLWIAYRIEPYWKDISEYEHCSEWRKFVIRLKYAVRSRSASSVVPKDVLEAIVDTMMPDIRAFFESEEGQREFEEWKANRNDIKKRDKEDT